MTSVSYSIRDMFFDSISISVMFATWQTPKFMFLSHICYTFRVIKANIAKV